MDDLARPAPDSPRSSQRRTPRVLVVDDYPDTREIVSEVLALRGFRVDTAENGLEALEKARTWHPDVIVLDLSLPDLDGFEVCRRLRAEEGLRSIPVLAYTAFTDDERRERAMAAGCAAVLIKPVPPAVLAETLRDLLRIHRPALQAGEPGPDDSWVRLATSRTKYREALPRRGAEVAELWREIESSAEAEPGALEALLALVHRLAGSAGTYGFPEVSRAAGKLERALERYRELRSSAAAESVARLVAELAQLTVRQGRAPGAEPGEPEGDLLLDPPST